MQTRLAPGEIRTLAGSWRLSLEAENKSQATLDTYGISSDSSSLS